MCALSVDGIGPVASHCRDCDRLIHVAALPQRTPGRGFVIAVDPVELASYREWSETKTMRETHLKRMARKF
jgi:hypothetical protein